MVKSMKTTITQKAEEIGISQGFLSNLLACRRHPQWSVAIKLAKAFNTDPSFWMKGESTSKERWNAFNKAIATGTSEKIKAALNKNGARSQHQPQAKEIEGC